MELTQNEKDIIEIIREIKPFETIEIRKDLNGKCDSYIARREQKIHFSSRFNK
jgi:hypothetical protein